MNAHICPSGQGHACPQLNRCETGCHFNDAELTPVTTITPDGADPSLPVVMFDKPWQWLQDLLYTAVYIGGSVVMGVLLLAVVVFATGLHRVLF